LGWAALIQWVDELLKSLEVLNVVLGLIESFGDLKLDGLPAGSGKSDLIFGLAH
jgi:hypothetical protein